MAVLNSGTVNALYASCVLDHSDSLEREWWFRRYAITSIRGVKTLFHPMRLTEIKPAVADLLMQLPDELMITIGGGASFLNMFVNKHNEPWTTMHGECDKLACLALALGMIRVLGREEKELHAVLPGGAPLIVVLDDAIRDYYKFNQFLQQHSVYKWTSTFD
jgi:hypothetical protein